MRRATLITLGLLVAQAFRPASVSSQAPANAWPHFRGSAALLGTTQATLPAKLKLLWTYEAGDAIDSSAAIVDGVLQYRIKSAHEQHERMVKEHQLTAAGRAEV